MYTYNKIILKNIHIRVEKLYLCECIHVCVFVYVCAIYIYIYIYI